MSDINLEQYIDLKSALPRVMGNQTIYQKMLNMFLDSTEFAALEEELEKGDYAKAGDVAHAIKGMTGNLGFVMLFETSTQFMNELRAGTFDPATADAYRDSYTKTKEAAEYLISHPEEIKA